MSAKSSTPVSDAQFPRARERTPLTIFQKLLLFVGGVVILVLGIHLEEGIRGHAAWRRYEAEAQSRGVKLTLGEYLRPKIPDAENFASIPIFEAAFRALDDHQPIPDPFDFGESSQMNLPKMSNSLKQARVDLGEWQKYVVSRNLLRAGGNDAAADVLKALEKYAEPLAQLRAASARPQCQFPVHWEQGSVPSLPHLALLRDATRLSALRLAAHLARGESVAAYEDFRDGLRLSTAMNQELPLAVEPARTWNAETMISAVWSGLAGQQWKEPELRQIEADLATLDWMQDYLRCLGGDRAAFNGMADTLVGHQQARAVFLGGPRGMNSSLSIQQRLTGMIYPAGWIYQSKVRANRYCDEMAARIDLGQRRWFGDRPVPSARPQARSGPEIIYHLAFFSFGGSAEYFEERYLYMAALTDQARLACALECFRLAHGSYPATLAELAPGLIESLPLEIVNGQPYHYRLTEDGSFILYSVGRNLRDDGGVLNPAGSIRNQPDWVWQYPAKQAP